MEKQPLVSVLTPCYNGENYVKRFLDSLLAQDYTNVEFFFINDGSTDATEEIFLSYQPKLEEKGWKIFYHKQPNGGPADALNCALKRFSGEYLACPDSDDILYPDFISAKVAFMEENPRYALCYCGVDFAREEDPSKIVRSVQRLPQNGSEAQRQDPLFVDILLGRDAALSAPALTYFFRSKDWIATHPTRQIYSQTSVGQNWQLLLPVAYKGPCGYINKRLARYIQRKEFHNYIKRQLPLKEQIRTEKELLFTVLKTIDMPAAELDKYRRMVNSEYTRMFWAKKLKTIPGLFPLAHAIYAAAKHLRR